MSKLILTFLVSTVFAGMVCAQTFAAEFFVSTTGDDTNSGSQEHPIATLAQANAIVEPGDTVWIRGGTYHLNTAIRITTSGRSDAQRIQYWAYENETPVFDFANYRSPRKRSDQPAISITADWLHIRGLEIANVHGNDGDHSISAIRTEDASHNIFERLNIHHIFGTGIFIAGGQGGNLILNCDSHDNYDRNGSQGDGQNADGFGIHYQSEGEPSIIRGCRAWMNSDDGYDLIHQEVTVMTENCWAFRNGFAEDGNRKPRQGNGNGFKMGSSRIGVRHVIQNCVAWQNRAAGFYANHSSGGNTWLNNTSYANSVQFNMLASPPGKPDEKIQLDGDLVHLMRNNIGLPNKNNNMEGVDSASNSWDLVLNVSSNVFASTSDNGALMMRREDGSLPVIDFLKLAQSSPLIDRGVDVGLPFSGNAPDLGAFEMTE